MKAVLKNMKKATQVSVLSLILKMLKNMNPIKEKELKEECLDPVTEN